MAMTNTPEVTVVPDPIPEATVEEMLAMRETTLSVYAIARLEDDLHAIKRQLDRIEDKLDGKT